MFLFFFFFVCTTISRNNLFNCSNYLFSTWKINTCISCAYIAIQFQYICAVSRFEKISICFSLSLLIWFFFCIHIIFRMNCEHCVLHLQHENCILYWMGKRILSRLQTFYMTKYLYFIFDYCYYDCSWMCSFYYTITRQYLSILIKTKKKLLADCYHYSFYLV